MKHKNVSVQLINTVLLLVKNGTVIQLVVVNAVTKSLQIVIQLSKISMRLLVHVNAGK